MLKEKVIQMLKQAEDRNALVEEFKKHNINLGLSFEDCKEDMDQTILEIRRVQGRVDDSLIESIFDIDPLLLESLHKEQLIREVAYHIAADITETEKFYETEDGVRILQSELEAEYNIFKKLGYTSFTEAEDFEHYLQNCLEGFLKEI